MALTIQYLAAFFGIVMVYFTYMYFRRRELSSIDLFIWGGVWVIFIFAVIFPQTLNIFLETFNIQGAIDFISIFAFIFIFGLVFYLYLSVRKIQRKMEAVVRETAIKRAEYKK